MCSRCKGLKPSFSDWIVDCLLKNKNKIICKKCKVVYLELPITKLHYKLLLWCIPIVFLWMTLPIFNFFNHSISLFASKIFDSNNVIIWFITFVISIFISCIPILPLNGFVQWSVTQFKKVDIT